jgi:hypothetical protein
MEELLVARLLRQRPATLKPARKTVNSVLGLSGHIAPRIVTVVPKSVCGSSRRRPKEKASVQVHGL